MVDQFSLIIVGIIAKWLEKVKNFWYNIDTIEGGIDKYVFNQNTSIQRRAYKCR